MAARSATLQMGYLLEGLFGGVALVWRGYGVLGLILGAGMVLAAGLILKATDPPEQKATESTVTVGSEGRS